MFWLLNELIKLKLSESGNISGLTHHVDFFERCFFSDREEQRKDTDFFESNGVCDF